MVRNNYSSCLSQFHQRAGRPAPLAVACEGALPLHSPVRQCAEPAHGRMLGRSQGVMFLQVCSTRRVNESMEAWRCYVAARHVVTHHVHAPRCRMHGSWTHDTAEFAHRRLQNNRERSPAALPVLQGRHNWYSLGITGAGGYAHGTADFMRTHAFLPQTYPGVGASMACEDQPTPEQ